MSYLSVLIFCFLIIVTFLISVFCLIIIQTSDEASSMKVLKFLFFYSIVVGVGSICFGLLMNKHKPLQEDSQKSIPTESCDSESCDFSSHNNWSN